MYCKVTSGAKVGSLVETVERQFVEAKEGVGFRDWELLLFSGVTFPERPLFAVENFSLAL